MRIYIPLNCGIIQLHERSCTMNYYKINKNKIMEYIKSGEKKVGAYSLGLEFEHIVVYKESFKSVPYENGVEEVMDQLLLKGWNKMDDEPRLLNIVKNGDSITLEPGAQLELSIKNCDAIEEIKERYCSFVKDIFPILESKNYSLLSIGYRPIEKIANIPMIPKERYKYMSQYLSQRGKYALNMMKGSASLQISLDYTSEEDYIKKNRVANYLSPAISYLYDNSPIFEGNIHEGNGARVQIWNNMDDERSRLIPGVLDKDFGYEDYADYILERPCIIALLDDQLVFTGNKAAKEVYENIEMTTGQIEHLFSMVFPDVRTKKYIEIRMSDSVPYPYNLSSAVLWKSILYHKDNLEYFYQESLKSSTVEIERLREQLITGEEEALKRITQVVETLLMRAIDVVSSEERKYIDLLIKLQKNHINLASYSKELLKKENSIQDALSIDVLSLENLKIFGLD